jgi:hypothetical protein
VEVVTWSSARHRDVAVSTEVEMLMRSAARFEVTSIVADARVEEVCEERGVSLGRALALVAARVKDSYVIRTCINNKLD